jgi:phosphatidyl-myo-inositol alpha-mannosyltransferase
MTTVLHMINGEHYAGAERVQDLLALKLPELGYDVAFAALKRGRFAAHRLSTGTPLTTCLMKGRWDLSAGFRAARIVERTGSFAIHAHTPRSLLIATMAATLSSRKLIYHVHGPTDQDTERRLANTINMSVERIAIRRADAVIAVSEFAADYATRIGVPSGKVTIVPNGVPTPNNHSRERDPDAFVVGCVALFRPKKGIETLLEAIAILSAEVSRPVLLRMIGAFESASYARQVEAHADELGIGERICWVGHSDNVYDEMHRMSVFVLPSLYGEGLPMVVLEAMAAGLPILATDVGGVSEAIENNVTGLLVEASRPSSMASQLRKLADDDRLRTELAAKAFARHVEHFSDTAMARAVAAVYDRLSIPVSGH